MTIRQRYNSKYMVLNAEELRSIVAKLDSKPNMHEGKNVACAVLYLRESFSRENQFLCINLADFRL
jgi:hypothetical protein